MKKLLLGGIFCGAALFFPLVGQATSVWLDPSGGLFPAGDTMSVEVKINNIETPINVAAVSIVFNPEQVQVVSIQRGREFNFWPTVDFSNDEGVVLIEGVNLLRGIVGSSTFATVVLRSQTDTDIELSYQDVELHAYDGQGSLIGVSAVSALYNNVSSPVVPFTTELPFTPDLGSDVSGQVDVDDPRSVTGVSLDDFADTGLGSDRVSFFGDREVVSDSMYRSARQWYWLWIVLAVLLCYYLWGRIDRR